MNYKNCYIIRDGARCLSASRFLSEYEQGKIRGCKPDCHCSNCRPDLHEVITFYGGFEIHDDNEGVTIWDEDGNMVAGDFASVRAAQDAIDHFGYNMHS